jgi:hypothetical protein
MCERRHYATQLRYQLAFLEADQTLIKIPLSRTPQWIETLLTAREATVAKRGHNHARIAD